MTAPTTSRIPALLTALWNATVPLAATVTVVDGPPLSWDPIVVPKPGATSELSYLFIGARPEDDLSVATSPQTRTTAGTARAEDMTPYATAISKSDDASMAVARSAAFGIVGALEQAIRADQTFGGAVAYTVLTVDRYEQRQQDDGAYAVVVFTIDGRAFLR